MKSLEELVNTTTAQISDLLPKIILQEVEEAARARRFGRNLVRINTDLVRTKGRSIVVGRRGVLTAAAVSEGNSPSAISEGTLSYTSNTISPSKIGTALKITQEAIDGANLDLIRDGITEAGIALADKEDLDIVYELLGRTAFAETVSGTYTPSTNTVTLSFSGSDPVLSITSVVCTNTVSTGIYFDAFDAKLLMPATSGSIDPVITGFKSSRTNYVDADSTGSLTYLDIVNTAGVIRANKWTPDFMLIHPNQMTDLIKDSRFVDVSKYGSREVILNGELGKISGLKILVSTHMIDGTALILASKRACWMAIKRNVDMKRWDNPSTDSVELYFYMEYGVSLTDEDAVAISVNHLATYAQGY